MPAFASAYLVIKFKRDGPVGDDSREVRPRTAIAVVKEFQNKHLVWPRTIVTVVEELRSKHHPASNRYRHRQGAFEQTFSPASNLAVVWKLQIKPYVSLYLVWDFCGFLHINYKLISMTFGLRLLRRVTEIILQCQQTSMASYKGDDTVWKIHIGLPKLQYSSNNPKFVF